MCEVRSVPKSSIAENPTFFGCKNVEDVKIVRKIRLQGAQLMLQTEFNLVDKTEQKGTRKLKWALRIH